MTEGRRSARTPTPTGPPNLWALTATRSAPAVSAARFTKEAACTASVKIRAVGALRPDGLHHAPERLDDADLVVGQHHGHQCRVAARPASARPATSTSPAESTGISRSLADPVPAAARHDSSTAGCSTAEHSNDGVGLVVARRGQRPEDGQVGGLRATRGEDDLAGIAPQECGDLVPRFLEQSPGSLRRSMAPGRVAERLRESLRHGLGHLGAQRCGGGVIEVGRSLRGRPLR